jgi:hypothetical protein
MALKSGAQGNFPEKRLSERASQRKVKEIKNKLNRL